MLAKGQVGGTLSLEVSQGRGLRAPGTWKVWHWMGFNPLQDSMIWLSVVSQNLEDTQRDVRNWGDTDHSLGNAQAQ